LKDVEETEGAFIASKYKIEVAQMKISGNHRIDAISYSLRSACIHTSTTTLKTGKSVLSSQEM